MNTKLIAIAIASGLAFGVTAQAGGKKHHEEESIDSANVPAAVQQAAEKEANGGKIVRWEKEGADYEAVIEKDGKQSECKFDADGNVKKHEEKDKKGAEEEND